MKLKAYVKKLNKLAEKYPNAQVVFSSDDEGNNFQTVNYEPTLGFYESREFRSYDPDDEDCSTINAVCVN